ncbi:hypothetical protein FRC10_012274 [Ceratobasidium sp. 414]|nr:hypothetical protein FRC10_012274 [Ceratobasidium sp. 414]
MSRPPVGPADRIRHRIEASGKGQVMCPNMTLINPLAVPEQKPPTKKGCMYPNSALMFPYPDSQPDTVSPAMWYNCTNSSTPFQVFTVNQSDSWTAFNLLRCALGSACFNRLTRAIYFFAADGHYTNIQVANSIIIPIGERCQFFVKLNQTAGDYLIRTSAVVLPQLITGYAIMSYNTPKADPTKLPTSKNPGPADRTLNLNVTRTEEFGWVLNGIVSLSFYHTPHALTRWKLGNKWHELPDDTTPLLFNPSVISELDPKVYMSYENGTLVDVIFTVTAGNPAMNPPHPMHKHGVKAWLLGSGTGPFPYPTVQDAVNNGFKGINLQNPPYRDDFVTPVALTGQAWTVMRFHSVDPGHPSCAVISMPTLQLAWWSVHHNFSRVNALRCTYSMVGLVMLEGAEQLVPGYVPNYYINQNKP